MTDGCTSCQILEVVGAYADIASRMAWDEIDAVVHVDATLSFDLGHGAPIELVGPDAVAAFGRSATAAFSFYSYQSASTVLLSVTDDAATGRSHALEVGVDAASGDWLEFRGRYDDDWRRIDGTWRFQSRRYTSTHRRRSPS